MNDIRIHNSKFEVNFLTASALQTRCHGKNHPKLMTFS